VGHDCGHDCVPRAKVDGPITMVLPRSAFKQRTGPLKTDGR
jgi:hypothetical protein